MFGLGITEIAVIFVVALVVFGPDKLPELARTLGRAMAELRRTTDEFKFELSRTNPRDSYTYKDSANTAVVNPPQQNLEAPETPAAEVSKAEGAREEAKAEATVEAKEEAKEEERQQDHATLSQESEPTKLAASELGASEDKATSSRKQRD